MEEASPMDDAIIIRQLELRVRIGVPAAERRAPQRITLSLRLTPARPLAALGDDLANTVDYAAVCQAVRLEAESKPRKLIETLAEEIATLLLRDFPLRAVDVEVRKYILPGTEFVAVSLRRVRALQSKKRRSAGLAEAPDLRQPLGPSAGD